MGQALLRAFVRDVLAIAAPVSSALSRPVAAAALAIPDLAALIFSAYFSGIRVDFQPPAWVIAAKSMSSSARSCAAPTRVECALTWFTIRSGIPIHCATRLKIGAMGRGTRTFCAETDVSSPSLNHVLTLAPQTQE
jgi:hypothetical protein